MSRRPVFFWGGLVAGWSIIGFGIAGVLRDSDVTKPAELVRWLVGAGIAHDAVVAPMVVLVGWLTWRFVPERARVPVRLALAASALLIAFTWPYARGYGTTPANPSVLPFDYGRNVVVGVGAIWLTAAVAVAVSYGAVARTSARSDAPPPHESIR